MGCHPKSTSGCNDRGTHRKYIKVCRKNKDGKEETLEYLYQEILNAKEPLTSSFLIQKLQKNDGTLEFAAIQKLVNMTLKYLIILNECEGTASVFDICEEKCDCPVDSIGSCSGSSSPAIMYGYKKITEKSP